MILDPTGQTGQQATTGRLATRRPTLDGATVGLLENGKVNAPVLLSELGELLTTRYGVARVVAAQKPHFGMPAPREVLETLGKECDAVLTAIGD